MPAEQITHVRDVSADWLTRALRESGRLRSGEVASVKVEPNKSVNATGARLTLVYDGTAASDLPSTLFLKVCAELTPFGDSEVAYYTTISSDMDDPPIPICYHAAYSQGTGSYHLLLQDLTGTHVPARSIPLTFDRATKTVDAMAQLHAHWWDDERLAGPVGSYPDAHVIDRYVGSAEPGLTPMLDAVGTAIPHEAHDLIRRIFGEHRGLLVRRAKETRDLTCIHGDPNPGNILSPLDVGGRAYLIDRQLFPWSLSVWTGVSDLAYMMVHWWDTPVRRQLEAPLLKRYHEQLEHRSVRDYPLTKVWSDYRLAAMQSLYVAAGWCVDEEERRANRWVWWPQLQKTLAACDDLDCLALLR